MAFMIRLFLLVLLLVYAAMCSARNTPICNILDDFFKKKLFDLYFHHITACDIAYSDTEIQF